MAKQSGIHQLRGKVRDMSYYNQKGVVDGLARRINQGMGERVKTDEAFHNTRLNYAEFGSAGSFAGAAIRSISDRQRAMLKDFATGDLAKQVRSLIVADKDNPWGQRCLTAPNWQSILCDKISQYAKLDFSSYVGAVFGASVTTSGATSTWTLNGELPAGWGSLLISKGANGAVIEFHGVEVVMSDYSEGSRKSYYRSGLIASIDSAIGTAVEATQTATLGYPNGPLTDDNVLTALLVVVKPYQTVNETKYTRQELCTYSYIFPTKA